MSKLSGYDIVARPYHLLERLVFGSQLKQSREFFLSHLRDAHRVLLLGDGDGRFLERLLIENPGCQVISLDASARMIARAQKRIRKRNPEAMERVEWIEAQAENWNYPNGHFDAVVTQFLLDNLFPAEAERLIEGISTTLKPGGLWVYADFRDGDSNTFQRWRNRLWLQMMYACFGLLCEVGPRRLPPVQNFLAGKGFEAEGSMQFSHGLLETSLYRMANPKIPMQKEAQGVFALDFA